MSTNARMGRSFKSPRAGPTHARLHRGPWAPPINPLVQVGDAVQHAAADAAMWDHTTPGQLVKLPLADAEHRRRIGAADHDGGTLDAVTF